MAWKKCEKNVFVCFIFWAPIAIAIQFIFSILCVESWSGIVFRECFDIFLDKYVIVYSIVYSVFLFLTKKLIGKVHVLQDIGEHFKNVCIKDTSYKESSLKGTGRKVT